MTNQYDMDNCPLPSKTSMIYGEFESNALFFLLFANIDIAMNSFKKYVAKAIKPIIKVIYPKYYKHLAYLHDILLKHQ